MAGGCLFFFLFFDSGEGFRPNPSIAVIGLTKVIVKKIYMYVFYAIF